MKFFARLSNEYLLYNEFRELTRTKKIIKIWIEIQVEKYECDDYEYRIDRVLMFR